MTARLLDNPAVAMILDSANFDRINRAVDEALESNHVSEPAGGFRRSVGQLLESMAAASLTGVGPVCSNATARAMHNLVKRWTSILLSDEIERRAKVGGKADMRSKIEAIIGNAPDAKPRHEHCISDKLIAEALGHCEVRQNGDQTTISCGFAMYGSNWADGLLSLLVDATMSRAAHASGEAYADLKNSNYSLFEQLHKAGYPVAPAGAAAAAKGMISRQDANGFMIDMPASMFAHLAPATTNA